MARYSGKSFKPLRRFTPDANTALLLNMDAVIGPWVFDESPHRFHPGLIGAPIVVPANEADRNSRRD